MWRVLGLLLLFVVGCDASPRRGALGESCTRRDDCEGELRCIAQVCAAAAGDDAGIENPFEPATEGWACASRRDCSISLVCVANVCVPASSGVDGSARLSGVGESCQASNDCMPDLACVGAMCTRFTLGLEPTTKQCDRVECAVDADCCTAFVPNENCDAYRENCEVDPVFCNTYRSLCECSQSCVNELCAASAPGCTESSECTSQQTPFCVEGTCRQCEADANCPGTGSQCVQGICMAACMLDEQCPQLHSCMEGECVEVGCQTDRECVFMTADADSTCRDGICETPCDTDSDCGGEGEGARFQICSAGQCVFVGCETDAECRALLGLVGQTGVARAVCR